MRWGGCRSALAGLVLLGGCAPMLRVPRPAQAVVDLGPRARMLSLVRVDGPEDSPTVVVHTLKGRAARQGYFQVEAWVPGTPVDESGRRAYVSIDVAEWAFSSPRTSSNETEPQARVRLLESSLRAVDDLLRALAPRPRVEDVELDVESPLLKPGADAATRGDLEEARASFESVYSRHPELAAAAYDLGLLNEALGHWEQAEALYAEAVSKKDDRLYRDALDSVRARLKRTPSGYAP